MGSDQKTYLIGSEKRDDGLRTAAWLLEDALNRGDIVASYPSTSQARETFFTVSSSRYDFGFAMVVMIFLTMFETPVWCDNSDHFFEYMPSHERCRVRNSAGELSPLKWNFTLPNNSVGSFDTVLLSNVPYIPPGIGLILEVYLMCVAARKFLLERKLQLRYFQKLDAQYCDVRVASLGLAMVALDLLDCLWFATHRNNFRIAFVARTVILCTLPGVRNLLVCALQVIGQVGSILAILVGSIIFFSWMSVTIFDGVKNGTKIGDEVIFEMTNKGMSTFSETVYTMFVAGNTDEFVDCLLPTYTRMRWTGFLWFFFLTLVQVLFLNMVLDTLVVTYLDSTEKEVEKRNKRTVKGIRKAFGELSKATDEKQVSKGAFLDLVQELSRSPSFKTISAEVAGHLFDAVKEEVMKEEKHKRSMQHHATLKSHHPHAHPALAEHEGHHREHPGYVDEGEFLRICALLDCECWTTQKNSPVEEVCPSLWRNIAWIRAKVTDGDDSEDPSSFDEFMNTVLMLNLVMVVLETSYELNKLPKPPVLDSLELIFSFAYVMEVGVKLCVYSWAEYSSSGSNMFDFATTWLLLLSSLLEAVLKGANFKAKRYMNILRLLRLIRVVKQLKRYKSVQFMIKTIAKLITSSTDLLSLLGIVVYFFTCLSVQLWGGLLHYDDDRLEGTEYKENNWLVLNFNDTLTAFGAWAVMLLCEYVPKYAEAIFAVLDGPDKNTYASRSWLIFLVFYGWGVCIVFELVKAFTIEVFLACWEDKPTSDAESEESKKNEKERKPSKKKELLCFGFQIEDETEDGETTEDLAGGELAGFKIIKDKLKHQGLSLHYIGGDKQKMKKLQEEYEEQLEEEEQEEQEREN